MGRSGSSTVRFQGRSRRWPAINVFVRPGSKKWITNGVFADYFTVGCKTEDGFTVILVERGPGVETRPIKTSYSPSAGTAFITFDDVRVPVGNTLGEEGGGIFVMLRYLII